MATGQVLEWENQADDRKSKVKKTLHQHEHVVTKLQDDICFAPGCAAESSARESSNLHAPACIISNDPGQLAFFKYAKVVVELVPDLLRRYFVQRCPTIRNDRIMMIVV